MNAFISAHFTARLLLPRSTGLLLLAAASSMAHRHLPLADTVHSIGHETGQGRVRMVELIRAVP